MPYAAKAIVQHEFDTDHLNVWVTFRHTMDQSVKPPLALWLLECDDVLIDIVDSAWQDAWTLLLTSDAIAASPDKVMLEYNGPNSNLQTTWGKDWEPWGPILSIDLEAYTRPAYFDRGDPALWDWDNTTLTADATWRLLDCSSIVPLNAKAVLFRVSAYPTAPNKFIRLRRNGNVNDINIAVAYSIITAVAFYQDLIVACDSERKIQYNIDSWGGGWFRFVVAGWFF